VLETEGDTSGLESAYDAYADRLYDYAASLLPATEVDRAEAVVTSALRKVAGPAGELPDTERSRPLLYAAVRAECVEFGPSSAPHGRRARLDDGPLEQRILSVVTLLTADEREVFDLSLRHGLPPHEVAEVSGRSIKSTLALLRGVRVLLAKAAGSPVQRDVLLAAMPLASAPALGRGPDKPTGRRLLAPRPWWVPAAVVLVAGGFVLAQLGPGGEQASRDLAPETQTVSTPSTEPSTTLMPAEPTPSAPAPSTAPVSAAPTPTAATPAGTQQPAPEPTGRPGKKPTKKPTKPPRPRPSP
jgi:DNA-directed RNA polymerase specialized sigma24 family protein